MTQKDISHDDADVVLAATAILQMYMYAYGASMSPSSLNTCRGDFVYSAIDFFERSTKEAN